MSNEVLTKAVERIKTHITKHNLKNITIIFHGGEPLLAPQEFYKTSVKLFDEGLKDICNVKYGIQTNGVLLNESWVLLLTKLNIGIGISVDGNEKATTVYRVDHKGNSSFPKLEKALKLLKDKEAKFGILTVMNPEFDPVEIFEYLYQFNPFQIDFLFPHRNHSNPPNLSYESETGYGYGKWLSNVFDYWWKKDLSETNVRIFADIIHLLLGGKYATESLGLAPIGIGAIQTDGGYEAVDSLKSTYDGAVATGKTVFDADIDKIIEHSLIGTRMERVGSLCSDCRACKYVNVCGGGYMPHRYHPTKGFSAPSIYCQDLKFIIQHIANALYQENDLNMCNQITNILQPL